MPDCGDCCLLARDPVEQRSAHQQPSAVLGHSGRRRRTAAVARTSGGWRRNPTTRSSLEMPERRFDAHRELHGAKPYRNPDLPTSWSRQGHVDHHWVARDLNRRAGFRRHSLPDGYRGRRSHHTLARHGHAGPGSREPHHLEQRVLGRPRPRVRAAALTYAAATVTPGIQLPPSV